MRIAYGEAGADGRSDLVLQRLARQWLGAHTHQAHAGDRQELEIGGGHRALEKLMPEDERIGRLREIDGRIEGAFMFAPGFGLWMLEMNFFRRPGGPAAFTNDIEEHAKREFGILAARQDIRHADLIFEADAATAGFGDRHMGRLLMQAEQADEILERRTQSRGGDGGIADETQIARLETVAEPQAEIRIARIARGFLEQRAKSGEFEAE